MKYFSHLCTAQDDDKFDRLFEVYSFEGYGVYWWLCEHVGRRKKTANDSPAYLFASPPRTSRVLERGSRRSRIATIIRFLDSIGLIEMEDKGDWLSIKIPKLNNYSAEWQKRLSKQNYGVAPEGTPESLPSGLGREVVDVKICRKEEKRSKGSRIGTDGPDASQQPEPEPELTDEQRRENLRLMNEAIGKIGGDTPQSRNHRVVESQGQLPEVETPEDLTAETIEKQQRLAGLTIEPPLNPEDISTIINAWTGYRTGRFDQYALASTLNGLSISGLDRSKVYEALEVV